MRQPWPKSYCAASLTTVHPATIAELEGAADLSGLYRITIRHGHRRPNSAHAIGGSFPHSRTDADAIPLPTGFDHFEATSLPELAAMPVAL